MTMTANLFSVMTKELKALQTQTMMKRPHQTFSEPSWGGESVSTTTTMASEYPSVGCTTDTRKL